MKVEYSRSFQKDLERIRVTAMLSQITSAIQDVRQAASLSELRHVKRVHGSRAFYRMRTGNFRIGFELLGDTIRFLRVGDRKDFYRTFP